MRINVSILGSSFLALFAMTIIARESVDSSEWDYKIIPNGASGTMLVSHNGEWALIKIADVANTGNVGRAVCVEATVEQVIMEGTLGLKIKGAKYAIKIGDRSLLEAVVPGQEIWLAGKPTQNEKGETTFAVEHIERLVPAEKRLEKAYAKYRKAEDWRAIILLADRIGELADNDAVQAAKYKDMHKKYMAFAIMLKTLDKNATNKDNPDDLIARAEEMIEYSQNKETLRKLIRRALQLNPDHERARKLQPLYLPELQLVAQPDGKKAWIDPKNPSIDASLPGIDETSSPETPANPPVPQSK